MQLENTNMQPLAALARKALGTEIEIIKTDRDKDVPFVVIDEGRKLVDAASLVRAFEVTQPTPYRRRGTYVAADIASLLRWMNTHCAEDAPVFAQGAERLASEWATPKLSLAGLGNYSSHAAVAWHDFGVRYDFPVTKAWNAWCAKSGEWLRQADFSEFVEAHLYEFSEPAKGEALGEAVTRMIEALGGTKMVGTPGKMYEVANGVKITATEKVEVALDRSTGEAALKFTEEHTGTGGRPVSIPKFFYIRVPIFFGEAPTLVGALLRYRNAGGGNVNWSYELFAPDLTVKAAFDKACAAVSGERVLFMGSPDMPTKLS